MDAPLDFEKEDELLSPPRVAAKRRKVIGLDDLLSDFYTERSKSVGSESKKSVESKGYNSAEEDDGTHNDTEIELTKLVNKCEKQVNEMTTEDEIPLWGQAVFGNQKSPPTSHLTRLGNCKLLQSLRKNELNISLDLKEGESLLEGLVGNGWLIKLAFIYGFVDDSIASWTFYTMLYSSNKELQVSACEFWCGILLAVDEADQSSVRLGWLPCYSHLKEAIEIYGYLPDTFNNSSSISKSVHEEYGCEGPPQNIRSWVKVLSACCQIRKVRTIFSTSEVEDFLVVIIHLQLDRQLQGLSFALHECMHSAINFFSESEWEASSKKISHSVAYRIPMDLNCLRVVECISVLTPRSKHLRSQLALQILIICFNQRASDVKRILELLMTVSVKDKDCDFFKLYIYLVLAENMLLSYHSLEERTVVLEKWCKYLRDCSSQISSTDWRFCAPKVRNKASYLLQNSMQR